jgi:carbonic anhydrase
VTLRTKDDVTYPRRNIPASPDPSFTTARSVNVADADSLRENDAKMRFVDTLGECRAALPSDAQRVANQLMLGNRLFRDSRLYHAQRLKTATAQRPSFLIVSCSDSRTDPALVLTNLEIGRLFQVRTAGHTVSPVEMESIKYAVRNLGPTLLVVLGHTRCGAVTAAYDATTEPLANRETLRTYPLIVAAIEPAVRAVVAQNKPKRATRRASAPKSREWLIDACAREHAILTARRIHSACAATISVAPMIYDVVSGGVRICCELLASDTTEGKVCQTAGARQDAKCNELE